MAGRANFLPYQIGADGKPQLALPGILAGAVNAVTAPYRAMNPRDYPDFNTEQEAADFALNMLGGGTAFGRAPKNALGMNVWHGSPHKFEPTELNDLGEFNAAKIGTGEGAQAYSHGHYTGEARGTGEGYQIQNAYKAFDIGEEAAKRGIPLNAGGRGEFSRQAAANKGDPIRAAKGLQNANVAARSIPIEDLQKMFSDYAERGGGYLYKVEIPDEHIAKMLDWDKPLSEQSESVQAAIAQLHGKDALGRPTNAPPLNPEDRGQWLYQALQEGRNQKLASEALAAKGIPGIRYLDAGSRGAEGGTSNFVVFPGNEHMMTILERNGQAMSPESQAIARYREIKGPKSVVRMEAALRTAGVPLPKNEPVAYIQSLVDRAHRRN